MFSKDKIIIDALCTSIKKKDEYIESLENVIVYQRERLRELGDDGNAGKTPRTV